MQIVLNIVHSTIPIIHRAFYDSYRTLYILRFLSYIVYFTIPIIHRTFYYPYHTSCILLFLSYIVHYTIPIIHRAFYDICTMFAYRTCVHYSFIFTLVTYIVVQCAFLFSDQTFQRLYFVFIVKTIIVRLNTKLPNSEQSSKGKVKTHKYINRQNQSTTGKLGKP